jgi:hypothetical protein
MGWRLIQNSYRLVWRAFTIRARLQLKRRYEARGRAHFCPTLRGLLVNAWQV